MNQQPAAVHRRLALAIGAAVLVSVGNKCREDGGTEGWREESLQEGRSQRSIAVATAQRAGTLPAADQTPGIGCTCTPCVVVHVYARFVSEHFLSTFDLTDHSNSQYGASRLEVVINAIIRVRNTHQSRPAHPYTHPHTPTHTHTHPQCVYV